MVFLLVSPGTGPYEALAQTLPIPAASTPLSPVGVIAIGAGVRLGGTLAEIRTPGGLSVLGIALPSLQVPAVSPSVKAPSAAAPQAKSEAARLLLAPAAALRRSAADAVSPAKGAQEGREGPQTPLSVLEQLAVPARSALEASGSADAAPIERMAAAFDGGAGKAGRALDAVPVSAAEAGAPGRLPGLSSSVGRAALKKGGSSGIKAPGSGQKTLSLWKVLKENRFLIAAAAGAAVGLAGINLGTLPVLSLLPGLFFGGLPWLAAPFIGLNVYKSFAHYSVVKESRTLLGFLVITVAGLAISAGVTMAMTSLLPVVNPASFAAAAIPGLADGGFSPMQFMLPIIGLFTGAALLYKRARGVQDGSAGPSDGTGWRGALRRLYDRAAGLVVNGRTAPFLVKAGRLGEKAADLVNVVFPRFIDIVGIPAVAVLLSMTMATGGLGLLSTFGGYYITAFAGMAVGFIAMLAVYFAFGARAKDFKELLKAALVGFSISSSSATMPTEKEALKAMGVSRKTREAVVPLGGVFNMYGTALYMGLTAFYALSMFGAAPTLAQYLNTALTVLVIAMGAPGIPASNITLLEPVLRQTGLEAGQINKVYTMILPADRILDMVQTALNVLGDMLPAVEQDRKRLRYVRAKNISEIRRKRAEEERAKNPGGRALESR